MNRVSLIDLSGTERRRHNVLNPSIILILVPVFLIISSSVYPAFLSSMENKEMLIISEALAQLKETNIGTSRYHSILPTPSSQDLIPSSPTPIGPSFSATSSTTSAQSSKTPIQDGGDLITATAIDPGDLVHVIWADFTPGNSEIFYRRDGSDFDPSTINLSRNAGISAFPKVAVSGNNVHVVWQDSTPGSNDIFYIRRY